MKNIQIIDGALNCVYDIFAAEDDEFALIFPDGTDIAFIDEVYARGDGIMLDSAFEQIWARRVEKSRANGIHGTIFFELEEKKIYYPNRRDCDAVNANGTPLRRR
ncbi:hypothetical protein [Pseudomonas ogarae]